jgi:hypothetical protein
MEVGTAPGQDDVVPRTEVGNKDFTDVSISKGFVLQKTSSNGTSNDTLDPSSNLFHMEPGRCLTSQLYAVSKAHVRAALALPPPLCIKRKKTV